MRTRAYVQREMREFISFFHPSSTSLFLPPPFSKQSNVCSDPHVILCKEPLVENISLLVFSPASLKTQSGRGIRRGRREIRFPWRLPLRTRFCGFYYRHLVGDIESEENSRRKKSRREEGIIKNVCVCCPLLLDVVLFWREERKEEGRWMTFAPLPWLYSTQMSLRSQWKLLWRWSGKDDAK